MSNVDKKITFYFVRHGQSEGNVAGVISGHHDHPLTEKGKDEARAVAQLIPHDVTAIYTSDLTRCTQTADIINENTHLSITVDARLRERDFGSFTGQVWAVFDPDGSIRAKDETQDYDYRSQGGESVAQVTDRLRASLEDIKTAHTDGEKVLVVSSAGIVRLMHHLYGTQEREIANASLHEFTL